MSNWRRPSGDSRFHRVELEQPGGSVISRCRGRWPVSMDQESDDDPPIPQRCRACLTETVNARVMTGIVQFDLSSTEDV